mmetsp:Transcript_76903/g.217545  ORF Transcript_76903/g.217545 Transcript_76903/m.217545 type:complete len:202 (+) Transcript_76903:1751-2356(+)
MLPESFASCCAGGLALQSSAITSVVVSGLSRSTAILLEVEPTPQSAFANSGSKASGGGTLSMSATNLRASLLVSASPSRSPWAMMTASSRAPNVWHGPGCAAISVPMSFHPGVPGTAQSTRKGVSQFNHKSFAANSWHFTERASVVSCKNPPRSQYSLRCCPNRLPSRATITLRTVRMSSSAASDFSTIAKKMPMQSWSSR